MGVVLLLRYWLFLLGVGWCLGKRAWMLVLCLCCVVVCVLACLCVDWLAKLASERVWEKTLLTSGYPPVTLIFEIIFALSSAQTNSSLLGLIGVDVEHSEEISSALKVSRSCTCRYNGQFLIFFLFDLQRNQLAFIERHIAGNDK